MLEDKKEIKDKELEKTTGGCTDHFGWKCSKCKKMNADADHTCKYCGKKRF